MADEEEQSHQPAPGRSEPRGITLQLRAGEIVGLAGLMGAGRTELLETLFGAGSAGRLTGTARLAGKPYAPGSPRDAIAAGVAFVPEDRKDLGLVLGQSIERNVTLTALATFARAGLVAGGRADRAVDRMMAELAIKAPNRDAPVRSLSGGNQQKVVFAKQLLTRPRLLLLDEPTRGVDVGAKAEIYKVIADLAREGLGVVVVSSELSELAGLCTRVLVMREGQLVAAVAGDEATELELLRHAVAPTDTEPVLAGEEI